ncbi:hypothetical protein AVEN_180464-1 [Araneus ventricosus]|uniref:Uncharacterized protein n=1 Tax=Araneus ventricosus TaxID=182803 RepID=A0A4Y2WUC1_ARAVE|nr:hypothetical protein AVEN_29772-1 [Araneus ventricosus]GBO40390.1 hypothetical protein AVEN_180464-1 [Araneus ventricosus]
MLLCRFSHVEGCCQNALCRLMQRRAVCVSTCAICCRCKVKPFQVRGKWVVSCRKRDFFPFPAAWMSRDSWQDVKCGPSRMYLLPSLTASPPLFFLED